MQASRSSKAGSAVAISGRRTPSPARTSNASRSRGRSNARKGNARSPSSSNGRSIRCVEPAGNVSPQRTNSSVLEQPRVGSGVPKRAERYGGKVAFHRDAPLGARLDQRSSGRSAAEDVASPESALPEVHDVDDSATPGAAAGMRRVTRSPCRSRRSAGTARKLSINARSAASTAKRVLLRERGDERRGFEKLPLRRRS